MRSIGGFFELELNKNDEYHQKAIRLNSARNALKLVIQLRRYRKLYIPYFTCDAILEPILKLKIKHEFYSIDANFEPVFNFADISKNEGFLYTNYFGIKDSFIINLKKKCRNIIIDNSQSFYSIAHEGIDTFYSPRKFFGVPDGAYLYLPGCDAPLLNYDISLDRLSHLFKRIELGSEDAYHDFKKNDAKLIEQSPKQMSKLTRALLANINYSKVRQKRINNFTMMHNHLEQYNKIKLNMEKNSVPMVYPFLTDHPDLKQKLISNRIFVATYWPNVLNWTMQNSIEYKYASDLIHIPIDQRYNSKDMKRIIEVILK